MFQGITERERLILDQLSTEPTCSVHDLGKKLGVSDVTIRTDLKHLSLLGIITRTHGGAIPAFHKSILDRQGINQESKNRIARAAADLIQDGDTVMILAGTTTALIPKYLLGKSNIHIVTDSTLLLPFIRANPALQLTITGGEFRSSTESFGGPMALEALQRFSVKIAFFGTDGFSPEKGLSTYQVEAAEMAKAMTERAERTIVLADSSKYGRNGFVNIMPLSRVDTLISDGGLGESNINSLKALGLEVLVV